MRAITDKGIALIMRFEGFSPTIYICVAGYPTIGYGHRVLAGEDFSQGISEPQAKAVLLRDVQATQVAVLRLIDVPLSNGHYDALVSFTYNLGAGALQRSALRRCINRGEYESAPAQLMRWVWAAGCRQKGLIARRKAEAVRYCEGT